METLNVTPGSPEWLAARRDYDCASEAASMLGFDKKTSRTELLRMKATGSEKEFSDWVRRHLLEKGHEIEAAARRFAEAKIGDLYLQVGVLDIDGLRLLASFDGLTSDDGIVWECKSRNAELLAAIDAGDLPNSHWPQVEQQLLISGADYALFTVSDGTEEGSVHFEYRSRPDRRTQLLAGWAQFNKDLAEYQPKDLPEKPQADAIMHLPALAVQIRGEVTLSNLPQFKEAAERFIAKINTELKTDEDFANAEATVKYCDKVEKDLELAKEAAIAQTASIDDLMRTIDFIKNQLRGKRLSLEKLVKDKKEWIKAQILQKAKEAFAAHVASLEAEIRPISLVFTQPDFIGAMKNKRTLASLHDAVDTTLANAKIGADATAKDIRSKLTWYRSTAADYTFLFNDLQQAIQKPQDGFQMLVNSRIADHKQKEEQRLQAERDRIAEEERVKAEARVRAQQQATQAQRIEAPAEQPAQSVGTGVHTYALRDVAPALASRAPALRLGQISERLGFAVTADFLASLGFPPAATDKSAKLYHDTEFAKICGAIAQHALSVGRQFPAQLAA